LRHGFLRKTHATKNPYTLIWLRRLVIADVKRLLVYYFSNEKKKPFYSRVCALRDIAPTASIPSTRRLRLISAFKSHAGSVLHSLHTPVKG